MQEALSALFGTLGAPQAIEKTRAKEPRGARTQANAGITLS